MSELSQIKRLCCQLLPVLNISDPYSEELQRPGPVSIHTPAQRTAPVRRPRSPSASSVLCATDQEAEKPALKKTKAADTELNDDSNPGRTGSSTQRPNTRAHPAELIPLPQPPAEASLAALQECLIIGSMPFQVRKGRKRSGSGLSRKQPAKGGSGSAKAQGE